MIGGLMPLHGPPSPWTRSNGSCFDPTLTGFSFRFRSEVSYKQQNTLSVDKHDTAIYCPYLPAHNTHQLLYSLLMSLCCNYFSLQYFQWIGSVSDKYVIHYQHSTSQRTVAMVLLERESRRRWWNSKRFKFFLQYFHESKFMWVIKLNLWPVQILRWQYSWLLIE